jgi:hypothetical protein
MSCNLRGFPEIANIKNMIMYDGPEKKEIIGNVLYAYYTMGSGLSKFKLPYIENTFKARGVLPEIGIQPPNFLIWQQNVLNFSYSLQTHTRRRNRRPIP